MALPNLSGVTLGHYQVDDRLGEGGVSVVYRATDQPSERQVALKVLDPRLGARPGFIDRFVDQTATIAGLGHPRIVPVYEVATRKELTYLSMRLLRGGTLKALLSHRPLDLYTARRIVHDVAGAVHAAHEAGVLHGDVKPTNVLIDTDGSAHVADFGLTPIRYGYAMGTPGYMAPEQAMGMPADGRTDVHGIGALLFEMVTGTLAYTGGSAPDQIIATVREPVPSASSRNSDLPAELDRVLFRALAKDPDRRTQTVEEFLDGLATVPWGTPSTNRADDQLAALIEASLDPAMATDEAGRITHWNGRAERTLGWPRGQIVGQPLVERLIAPRHREMFERVLATLAGERRPLPDGHTAEVMAVRRDGTTLTLETSISPIELAAGGNGLVVFCRDVSERDARRSPAAIGEQLGDVLLESPPPDQLLSRMVERGCEALGFGAGAVWMPTGHPSQLRCQVFWHSPRLDVSELRMLSQGVQRVEHIGLAGRTLTQRQPAWETELEFTARSRRERAAARAGLVTHGAVPILDGDGTAIGTFEYFSSAAGQPAPARRAELDELVRHLAPILRHSWTPGGTAPTRFRLDPRNTHLAFSCAFMKFMTVHGVFRDFHGGIELDGEDPATVRAECTTKAASVDTGSLDRDYHLCSADFFAVETFPDIVFRSTRVNPLGDQRFRVIGELTIRDVTRPIRLDVRLEDTEVESSEVARMTLTASTVINRLDWFLDWEKALQAGRWIVGDQVRLDLVITLVRRPTVPAPAF